MSKINIVDNKGIVGIKSKFSDDTYNVKFTDVEKCFSFFDLELPEEEEQDVIKQRERTRESIRTAITQYFFTNETENKIPDIPGTKITKIVH
ncbi:hypothetical protein [Leuconostoc mesenteroides]|uniref:hypothetical protein n=1 Tax=Leuconostoc mesenteroides TaxID=1245 RepID=UPI002360027C|nr:hypothetical protein [Leuconostoc mesenteroides]